jgi:hypothetical protein
MQFNVSATSQDLRESVHEFPGDSAISKTDYRTAIFGGYVSSISTLYGVASGSGLDVDTETFERWKRFSAAAGLIDDYLDDAGDIQEANREYSRGIHDILDPTPGSVIAPYGQEQLLTAALLLRNSTYGLPEQSKAQLVTIAKSIGDIAVRKSTSESVDEYIELLTQEALLTSQLVINTASEYVQAQGHFRPFTKWCDNALIFATLGDSARDLWSDAREGRTAVQPNTGNALRIMRRLVRPLRILYHGPEMRKASLYGVRERARFSLLPTNLAMHVHSTYPPQSAGQIFREWQRLKPQQSHAGATVSEEFLPE